MLFGATPFSTISFGGNVVNHALVNVTGNRVNFTIGNVTIAGQATATAAAATVTLPVDMLTRLPVTLTVA